MLTITITTPTVDEQDPNQMNIEVTYTNAETSVSYVDHFRMAPNINDLNTQIAESLKNYQAKDDFLNLQAGAYSLPN